MSPPSIRRIDGWGLTSAGYLHGRGTGDARHYTPRPGVGSRRGIASYAKLIAAYAKLIAAYAKLIAACCCAVDAGPGALTRCGLPVFVPALSVPVLSVCALSVLSLCFVDSGRRR
jgi:hypothetical protein